MNPPASEPAPGLGPGWKALLFCLAFLLTDFLVNLAIALGFGPRFPLWGIKTVEALAVLALTRAFLRGEGRSLEEVGLKRNLQEGRHGLRGVAWGAGLQLVAACIAWTTGAVQWRVGTSTFAGLLGVVLLFAVVALFEELVFRGYAFQRLTENWGFWPAAVWFAGGAFAAVHLGNPNLEGRALAWSLPNIALAGLLFALMWRTSGSLAMPIGAHFGWNVVQGPLLGFGVSGNHLPSVLLAAPAPDRPFWLHGGAFGMEATLPCALLCALAVGWQWRQVARGQGRRAGAPT